MSFETDEQFVTEQSAEYADMEAKARVEKVKALKRDIEKGKPYKELITGKETEWAKVKEETALHAFSLPSAGNDIITKDFIAGIRYCLELIDGRVEQFDTAFEQLGKE